MVLSQSSLQPPHPRAPSPPSPFPADPHPHPCAPPPLGRGVWRRSSLGPRPLPKAFLRHREHSLDTPSRRTPGCGTNDRAVKTRTERHIRRDDGPAEWGGTPGAEDYVSRPTGALSFWLLFRLGPKWVATSGVSGTGSPERKLSGTTTVRRRGLSEFLLVSVTKWVVKTQTTTSGDLVRHPEAHQFPRFPIPHSFWFPPAWEPPSWRSDSSRPADSVPDAPRPSTEDTAHSPAHHSRTRLPTVVWAGDLPPPDAPYCRQGVRHPRISCVPYGTHTRPVTDPRSVRGGGFVGTLFIRMTLYTISKFFTITQTRHQSFTEGLTCPNRVSDNRSVGGVLENFMDVFIYHRSDTFCLPL